MLKERFKNEAVSFDLNYFNYFSLDYLNINQ